MAKTPDFEPEEQQPAHGEPRAERRAHKGAETSSGGPVGESGNMEGRTSQERRDGVIETFRKAYKAVSKALPGSKRGLTKVPTNKNVTASSLIKKCAFSSLADVAKQRHRRGLLIVDDEGNTSGKRSSNLGRWSEILVLNPDRLFRRTWDFAQLLLLVYICAAVPLRVGFDRPTYGGWFITDLLVDLFFIIDIGLNFITAYQDDDGDLSTDLRDISRHYVRTWLALDIVAAFPVDYIIRGVEGELGCSFTSCPRTDIAQAGTMQPRLLKLFRVLRITRLFKLLRIARITKLLEKYQAIFFVILPAISIARQIIVLGFLGHLLGCFFYYFSTSTWRSVTEQRLIEEGILSNWIIYEFHGEEYELLPVAPGVCIAGYTYQQETGLCHTLYGLGYRYVSSLYWAFTTMTTVGYGDITATTLSERIYNIFSLIVGGFVFSGIISRMGSILSTFDAATKAQHERMEMVKVFLRDVRMPAHLRAPVLAFFKKQRVKSYDTRQVLSQLPFELRAKVVKFIYEEDVKNAPVLGFRRDDIFTTDLCMRIQMYSVSAYTFVYQSGETGSDIFILIKGDLVLVDVDRDGIIGQLCPGAMFGVSGAIDIIRGLDYRPRRKENVYALSGCDMLKISLEDFLEIIITYPDILPPFEEYFEEFSRLTATKNSANLNNAVVVWRSATSGRNGPMAHPGRLRMDDRHVASARKLRLDMMEGHSADLLERVKRLGLMWRDRARFMGRKNRVAPALSGADRTGGPSSAGVSDLPAGSAVQNPTGVFPAQPQREELSRRMHRRSVDMLASRLGMSGADLVSNLKQSISESKSKAGSVKGALDRGEMGAQKSMYEANARAEQSTSKVHDTSAKEVKTSRLGASSTAGAGNARGGARGDSAEISVFEGRDE